MLTHHHPEFQLLEARSKNRFRGHHSVLQIVPTIESGDRTRLRDTLHGQVVDAIAMTFGDTKPLVLTNHHILLRHASHSTTGNTNAPQRVSLLQYLAKFATMI